MKTLREISFRENKDAFRDEMNLRRALRNRLDL